jgi:hypothetical protein
MRHRRIALSAIHSRICTTRDTTRRRISPQWSFCPCRHDRRRADTAPAVRSSVLQSPRRLYPRVVDGRTFSLYTRQDSVYPLSNWQSYVSGQNLECRELCGTLARLGTWVDAGLANGEDSRTSLRDTKDCFVSRLGDFQVVIAERVPRQAENK